MALGEYIWLTNIECPYILATSISSHIPLFFRFFLMLGVLLPLSLAQCTDYEIIKLTISSSVMVNNKDQRPRTRKVLSLIFSTYN